jgi:hypothetical protein
MKEVAIGVLGIICLTALIVWGIWISCAFQATYWNKIYGTHYTAEDFFWAEHTIYIKQGVTK